MCCRDYTACVFAVIWSIVQTGLHIGWCMWGMHMYECKIDLSNSPSFKYFVYLTYFYTNSCQNATLEKIGMPVATKTYILITPHSKNASTELNYTSTIEKFKSEMDIVPRKDEPPRIQFPSQSAAASRTYNIFYVFFITDILWLISALGLLVGTVCNIRLQASALLFFPWNAVLLFVIFFDAVCAVWYGTDISQTYGLPNWFTFIGVTNLTGVDQIETNAPKASTTFPSILMMSFFSRFFIIWIVNLFLFFRIVQASINAYQDFDDEQSIESKSSDQRHLGKIDNIINHRPRHFQVCDANPNAKAARIRRWQLYYGTDDEEEKEEKVVRRHPRRYSKQKQIKEGYKTDSAFQPSQSTKVKQDLTVTGGYEGDRSSSPSPLPECHQQVNSSEYASKDVYVLFKEQPSSPEYTEDYQNNNIQNQSYVRELRAQLPWSYFRDRNNVVLPKVRIRNDVMQPVPVLP